MLLQQKEKVVNQKMLIVRMSKYSSTTSILVVSRGYTIRLGRDVCRIHNPVLSSSMIYHRFVARTRQVPLVGQELFIQSEHLSSSPVFSELHVTQYQAFFSVLQIIDCIFFFWPFYCLSCDLRLLATLFKLFFLGIATPVSGTVHHMTNVYTLRCTYYHELLVLPYERKV